MLSVTFFRFTNSCPRRLPSALSGGAIFCFAKNLGVSLNSIDFPISRQCEQTGKPHGKALTLWEGECEFTMRYRAGVAPETIRREILNETEETLAFTGVAEIKAAVVPKPALPAAARAEGFDTGGADGRPGERSCGGGSDAFPQGVQLVCRD
jgi:hypothetical protein